MKKLFPIILALTILALLFQFVIIFFVKEHDVSYSLKTENNSYAIREKFKIYNDVPVYDFTILDRNDSFYTFSFVTDLNKQDQIIKDIKYFTTKDLECIFPIYRRNISSDVHCLYKGEQVSYDYLKQINNYDISIITKKLKKMGYNSATWNEKSIETTESGNRRIKVYTKNILDDYIFTMWNYNGIYILKDGKVIDKNLLSKDQYEATHSAMVDKYYVVMDCSESAVGEVYFYNIKEMGKGYIPIDNAISSNNYYNGVYDKKLYVTDLDNENQYTIDPYAEKIELVGDRSSGYKTVINGKLATVSADQFLKERVYFTNAVKNVKITKKYGDVDIRRDGNFYYFKTKDNKIYRAHEENLFKAELLFSFDNISEWKVDKGDILVVVNDTLYFYNSEIGLSPIAVNPELKYNYKNVCDFWKR